MKFQVITLFAKKAPVIRLCELFGVSPAGFYAARKRRRAPVRVSMDEVNVRAAFEVGGRAYGSRRVSEQLALMGCKLGRHRVRTVMATMQLRPQWRRKFVSTTDSKHTMPLAPNLLSRQFNPSAPNLVWVADMTYIRTRRGWMYLAAVMDLFSRKIVGWATAPNMPSSLVCEALQMAIKARKPAPGLIMHSDRGGQYASKDHTVILAKHGMLASMSRKGDCWDNAVMERFFLNLKMERVWQQDYANLTEARSDVADYISCFYNDKRLHSTLNYRSPNAYEKAARIAA